MSLIDSKVKLSNLWENYNNMPTKTTILDRIIEKEMSERMAYLNQKIAEATSQEYIKSKQVEGNFFKGLERAKSEQSQNTQKLIAEMREFIGKGKYIDMYV